MASTPGCGTLRPLAALTVAIVLASLSIEARASDGSVPRHAATPAATADPIGAPPFVFPPASHTDLQTLVPTTTSDVYDPADLIAPGTGRLSLREAFVLANHLNIEVTIVLQHGAVYRLERCGPFEGPPGEMNELVHTANHILTVAGQGATIFQDCDGAGVIVQQGGDQLLNLADVVISGGRSKHVPGGGVWSSGTGTVRISNMVVVDNQVHLGTTGTGVSAGGVASNGDIVISGATFAQNVSAEGAGAAAATGAVKAVKATFYANSGRTAGALQAGARVGPAPPPGPPPMVGRNPDGVSLIYATLSDNSSPQIRLTGGGLTSFASIVSASGTGALCELGQGSTHSLGFNYASGGGGCGFAGGAGDTDAGSPPGLERTAGMMSVDVLVPVAGSPVRDAVPAPQCLPPALHELLPVYSGPGTDELGVSRPQGGGCDIGSIEAITGSLSRQVAIPPPSDLPIETRWAPAPVELNWFSSAIRVTTSADELKGSGTSLRDAFVQANAADHDSIVVLEPGTVYRLTRCVAPQIARDNESNELIHSGLHALTVYGGGSTIIQTCDGSAVIKKYGAATLSLNGLTITGGRSIAPGGGIFSAGSGELRLEHSWVTGNVANAAGGGVAAFGSVVLIGSTLSGNKSFEFGGGMAVTADVTAVNSSVFDNEAGIAVGGIGIHGGIVTLLFSTVAHNTMPNIAAGRLTALGSIVASPVPPIAPPGGAPEGAGHGPGPGGPPANCAVQNPVTALAGNLATDHSCGFARVVSDAKLRGNRPAHSSYLIPQGDSPARGAVEPAVCQKYRSTSDQLGHRRPAHAACDSGATLAQGPAPSGAAHGSAQ